MLRPYWKYTIILRLSYHNLKKLNHLIERDFRRMQTAYSLYVYINRILFFRNDHQFSADRIYPFIPVNMVLSIWFWHRLYMLRAYLLQIVRHGFFFSYLAIIPTSAKSHYNAVWILFLATTCFSFTNTFLVINLPRLE